MKYPGLSMIDPYDGVVVSRVHVGLPFGNSVIQPASSLRAVH
jgi:hypothetical protein